MNRNEFLKIIGLSASTLPFGIPAFSKNNEVSVFCTPLMAGELSQNSVILQTRLSLKQFIPSKEYNDSWELSTTDIKGTSGKVRFELSEQESFKKSFFSEWQVAKSENDFIVKKRFDHLKDSTHYYYRAHFKISNDSNKVSNIAGFTTLPAIYSSDSVQFVVSSCMNLGRFFLGHHFGNQPPQHPWQVPYKGQDRNLGYPSLEAILNLKPKFWVQTGDNVYYDQPPQTRAESKEQLRAKWHRQMGLPRMVNLLKEVPVYWMKDDHDFRFDDSDLTNRKFINPSPKLGITTFKEQVPVVPSHNSNDKTYRTYKINKLVQIWMTEGRDYRSPNRMDDGPDKTIWGKEQYEWLKSTLLKSDATFKIMIVPDPMIGPDDAWKHDNHVDYGGFRYERDHFFRWLKRNDFDKKNLFFITGDRHWQYHSIHPIGFEEFGTGTMVTQNSRIGREPGDPQSTDPMGLITQKFIQKNPTGGFIQVKVGKNAKSQKVLTLTIYDWRGNQLYQNKKYA